MCRKTKIILIILAAAGISLSTYCGKGQDTARNELAQDEGAWFISALPSSVRLNPVTGKIIEDRPDIYKMEPLGQLLERNWVYDGDTVRLFAARGEYVSFQLVLGRVTGDTLKDIFIEMSPFSMEGKKLQAEPELFLGWSVELKTNSRGYEKSSYGPGWYPDALIPFKCLQIDPERTGRLLYPLSLPDFRNRIDNQRYQMIWIDQFVPLERDEAPPGIYTSRITVKAGRSTKQLPVVLKVWDFALPNQNRLAGNIQQSGFVRRLDEKRELELYQLFKKHRIVPTDPSYRPSYSIKSGKLTIDWTQFDARLKKYFTGEAFTASYGYQGPGYGEPLELFVLPFNCAKHKATGGGWPDVGGAQDERKSANRAIYIDAIKQVRRHLLSMVDPAKTQLVVFQNGLDESYFPEAWDRMVYYGKLFKEYFPEAAYRVDGGYSREAMEVIHEAIDYWCCHSVGYNMETVEEYRKLGIKDWVYGPVLYERRANSGVGSSTFIDLELTNERAISWACWKYRTLTWCSWGIGSQWVAAWYSPETWKHAIRRKDKPTYFRSYNGNGQVVYAPGIVPSVNVICPSLRLKNMRDGVEEYEYFRLLSRLDGNSERADEVVNRIIDRPFGEQSIGNLDVWNHNPAQWDAARVEVGKLIEQALARQ